MPVFPLSLSTSISFAPRRPVHAQRVVLLLPHVGELASPEWRSLLAVGVPEVKERGMESWGPLVPHSNFDTEPFMEQ